MKSWLQCFVYFVLLVFPFIVIPQNLQAQNDHFVGSKIIKEGNRTAIQTIPEKYNSKGENQTTTPQINKHSGDRYVLGGNQVWSFQDPLSIANRIELNDDGSVPLTSWGLNTMRVSLYNENNNTPVWEHLTVPNDPSTDVSDDGSVIALTQGTEFDILDKTTGNATYQMTMPDTLWAAYAAVSRDGKYALFLAQANGNGTVSIVYSFDLTGGTPVINWTLEVPVDVITNWTGANYSAQNDKVVVNGRNHMYVLDRTNGTLIWDHFVSNTETPAVISGDGSIVATADNSGFVQTWLFDSANSAYNLLWQYRIPVGGVYTNWASSIDISADGNTIVVGTLIWDNYPPNYDGSVIAFDTYGGGIPIWTYSGLGDYVDDVALSDDGRVAAVATWGDINNQSKPDLLVFDVETGALTYSVATPGSFFTVDISHDGSKVFAGGKAVHARAFGNGGIITYDTIDLGGGFISGTVDLINTSDDSGVTVKATGTVRSAVTDANGNYTIQNVSAGTYSVTAEKPGYTFGNVSGVVVTNGVTTSGINFSLDPFPVQTPVLQATNNEIGAITLSWILPPQFPVLKKSNEMAKAVGDPYNLDEMSSENIRSATGKRNNDNNLIDYFSSPQSRSDSIFIYRGPVHGGPYTKIAGVDLTQQTYTDSTVYPLTSYYYVVNIVTSTGESQYSNEVVGQVNDSLFTFDFDTPMGTVPVIDGVISPGEWDDAFKIDVSDVLGYSGSPAVPQGSVFMYFKFDDQTDMLYIAGEDFLNPTLDDNEGFGLYFDDNHNKTFEPIGSLPIFQEGNFWAYWHPSGSDLRFRQIFKGGGVGTVDTLTDGQVAFSDGSGYLQGEVAIPMGFMEGYQLQVYGPDKIVGLGAFLIARVNGNPLFNGWWPQTMNSVFDPNYFGDEKINVSLTAPPQIPGNISVNRQGANLSISWSDPTLGLDNEPLSSPPTMTVYKNGVLFATVAAGVENIIDDEVTCGDWYEYKIGASIVVNNDTLTGPIGQPVGNFACGNPVLTKISYDDSTWDYFSIVSATYDYNKFGLRFTPPFYPARIIRLVTTVNSDDAFDFTVQSDSGGLPTNRILAGPYRTNSNSINPVSSAILTIPGEDPPTIYTGDFWVVINYLPQSPTVPGIGVDSDQPYSNRGMYYTRTSGWQTLGDNNLMITAYITDTTTISGNEQIANKIPKSYELMQNYPNPFNPTTLINYQLPENQTVTLEIYNSLGEKIRTLVDETQAAGFHSVQWKGDNNYGNKVASGMYLYRITAGRFTSVKKMLLLK